MHKPVLLKETIDLLKVQKGKQYIDCTFGFGGHSRKIIERDGKVLGIDVDEESISLAKGLFSHFDNLILVSDNFRNLKEIAKRNGIEKVSGILLDLGMSSWQIDCSGRGFSFTKNEPLDMRMDKSLKVTASDLIKVLNKGEFYDLLSRLGEEGCARDIGISLIRARGIKEIKSTQDLAKIIEGIYRQKYHGKSKKNPATKVFQALRIAVNNELGILKEVLPIACDLLEKNGRLAIISFHSLEDRIVKEFFKETDSLKIITKKPVEASPSELAENPRARSAKLRVAEKN